MAWIDGREVDGTMYDLHDTQARAMIAGEENTAAQAAHSKGAIFMLGDELRKATTAIAAGATISNSNSDEITVSDELAAPFGVFGEGTNIESVDLDDYKSNHLGRFYTTKGDKSATLTNCPYTKAAGCLTVEAIADTEAGVIIQQTWQTNMADAQVQTYIRKWRGTEAGWSAWMRIPCAFDELLMSTMSLGASGTAYATVDLDTLKAPGIYRCTGSNSSNVTNKPTANSIAFVLIVRGTYNTTSFRQELLPANDTAMDKIYVRNCVAGTWTPWYMFSGTVVS